MHRVGRATLATILVAVCVLGAVASNAGEALDREQALALLAKREDVKARRQGAEALGETGVMADVPILAEALRDSDVAVRALAEQSLWLVWSRSGDPDTDAIFSRGVEQLQRQEMTEAIETFTAVIKQKPDFSEGWNKRATVYYLVGDFEKSLADCDEVMKRNPVHFGALSGYGMIYLQLGKPEQALPYFERALAVNPNLAGIEQMVEALKQFLEQQRKDSI